MKHMLFTVSLVLMSATTMAHPLPIFLPDGSSLTPVAMLEDQENFKQAFSGSVRVQGTFEARWALVTEFNRDNFKRNKRVLSMVFHPVAYSAKLLPSYAQSGDPQEIWLYPIDDVVKKLLPPAQARRLLNGKTTHVIGTVDFVLNLFELEVTCDQVSYTAQVAEVANSRAISQSLAKLPKLTNEGCS